MQSLLTALQNLIKQNAIIDINMQVWLPEK